MNKTAIEWTDFSWNPVTGCRHGCNYCYAASMYRRFGRSFEPTFHPERLEQPLSKRGAARIFVGSVTDMFGDWVPASWLARVFKTVRACPEKSFQFLTKNPMRLPELSPYPPNCWIGVTANNQAMADAALGCLSRVKASVKYLSCEPLFGPIRLPSSAKINWLIIGACTGAHRSQPAPEWVRDLTTDGRAVGAAIFYKPNLVFGGIPPREFPSSADGRPLLSREAHQ